MTALYLADPAIRREQVEILHATLPAGWRLTETPGGAAAILTENVDVDGDLVEAIGPSLRLVACLDTGRARVQAPAGVRVVALSNTALVGVAEHTILLMMALSRQLFDVVERTRRQAWLPERSTPILTEQRRYTYNWIGLEQFGVLYRKTLGLIGLGLIGRATAARARAFGMRLLYTQRHRLHPDEEQKMDVQWRALDDLLRESDFVSLHHRFQEGEESNDKHIGARELSLMKPTAFLINTARGRLVDEDALADALRRRALAGAALDVFRHEPLPADHPFWELAGPRLILTPHVAGAPVAEAWQTIANELVELLQSALDAQPLRAEEPYA